jgi:hypothetical protein
MPIFNKIITLSKQLATSLLRDEEPTSLHNSDLFSEEDKQYILHKLTDENEIKERLKLTNQINKQDDWNKIRGNVNVPVKRLPIWRYAAAAVIIGVLASTFIFKDEIFNSQPTVPAIVDTIEAGTNKATLTLENGQEVPLIKGTSYQTQNASSNGEAIIYTNNTSRQLVYNYLTIPRGGQFQLTLSDGTKVWLNSETQLKYPVSFTDGESRQVELVYGEAYFDVSPSSDHQGADFKVYHHNQEVQVLGTEFNIKAYKDETNIYTTLVEGKVAVKYEGKSQNLKPNQQSNYNVLNNALSVVEVDVYNETSWREGVFSFDGKSLKEIMTVLSRWYDVDVQFNNTAIQSEEFVGVLGKNQNLDSILSNIKNFGVIKDYQISNRKVILE